MTQEHKDLLFKDLCARLPYGVKVQTTYINKETKEKKDIGTDILSTVEISMLIEGYEEHKPCLFPLSSMTEEQKKYIDNRWGVNKDFDFKIDPNWGKYVVDLGDAIDFINWLIENHFDFNGLIPMGLAIDATGKNIY